MLEMYHRLNTATICSLNQTIFAKITLKMIVGEACYRPAPDKNAFMKGNLDYVL